MIKTKKKLGLKCSHIDKMFPHKRLNLTWMKTQTMKWIYPQHFVNTCIQNRNWTNKAIFTIGSVASNWACALLYCYKYGPHPAALAASQLQNKVQAVLPRPRHPLRSQPGYLMETVQSVGVSKSRSGLCSSSTSSMDYSLPRLRTKFGERAFSHADPATWNALPNHICAVADPVKFQKLLKSHYISQAFNICWFLCFSWCFSIWLTFVMHLWSRSS